MQVETTVEKALFIALASRIAPANIQQRRVRREGRKRIEAQIEHAVLKAGIKLGVEGGFTIPKNGQEPESTPVQLELTLNQMEELGEAIGTARWPRLVERQEDTLLEIPDEMIAWIEQGQAEASLQRIPKKARRAAIKALEEDDDDA